MEPTLFVLVAITSAIFESERTIKTTKRPPTAIINHGARLRIRAIIPILNYSYISLFKII
jgi:hypothetical protein